MERLSEKSLNVTRLVVRAGEDIHGTVQLHRMSLFELWVCQMRQEQLFSWEGQLTFCISLTARFLHWTFVAWCGKINPALASLHLSAFLTENNGCCLPHADE